MPHASRRIDHVVVAVHDLDAAGAFYERLGFTVGARNRHPWGTENRLIQFGSSFIELITVGSDAEAVPRREEGQFSFGGFVGSYLRMREGLAMLALDSNDAQADAARFAREGIGSFEPFFFQRSGRRPDGGETRLAFTLAFATAPSASEAGFFVCQQHFPENFWNPAFQRHENGASGIAAVGLTSAFPEEHAGFLAAFSGSTARRQPDGSLSVDLLGGRLVVAPDRGTKGDLRFQSVTIRTPDTAAQAARLVEARVPFGADRHGLSVAADAAFGVLLRFETGDAR